MVTLPFLFSSTKHYGHCGGGGVGQPSRHNNMSALHVSANYRHVSFVCFHEYHINISTVQNVSFCTYMAGCPCQVVEGLAVLWHFNQPTNKLKLKIEPQRNIKFQHIKSQFSTSSLACTNVQCQQFFWLVGWVGWDGCGCVDFFLTAVSQCQSLKTTALE